MLSIYVHSLINFPLTQCSTYRAKPGNTFAWITLTTMHRQISSKFDKVLQISAYAIFSKCMGFNDIKHDICIHLAHILSTPCTHHAHILRTSCAHRTALYDKTCRNGVQRTTLSFVKLCRNLQTFQESSRNLKKLMQVCVVICAKVSPGAFL